MSWPVRSLAVMTALLPALALVAEDEVPAFGDPPKDAPAAAPAAPAAPAAKARTTVTNAALRTALDGYVAKRGLKVEKRVAPGVEVLVVGGGTFDVDGMIGTAQQTLAGLEIWTGRNRTFLRDPHPPEENILLVAFSDAGQQTGFLDHAGGKRGGDGGDADLARKVAAVTFVRGNVAKPEVPQRIPRHWAAFSTAGLAISAFYAERGAKPPVWLREGLAAEMQRLQCANEIHMTTVAYELGDNRDGKDWPETMAKLIEARDRLLFPANGVMLADLQAMPAATYRQCWSLATFVRARCGSTAGAGNRLLALLEDTATGTSSAQAVKKATGLEDPALTRTWHAWALENRKMKAAK